MRYTPVFFNLRAKVSVDPRSDYQLLSTMRIGKEDNILKQLKKASKTEETF